jgi:3-carboxy-cis,cis-muconate cycloisomerase
VNTERMRHNLAASNGLVFAEAVSLALAPSLGKMPAHQLIEAACEKSLADNRPLQEVLRAELLRERGRIC